jgi:electron transfer flavoprotein alpha subunit
MSGIVVVMEQKDGRISRISGEALTAANRLGAELSQAVTAVVIGADTETLASDVSIKGATQVVRVEHPLLANYTADGFTLALFQLIQSKSPAYAVFPHTYQVRDYAPALAARLGEVLISDVVAITDGPIFTRQLMQGRLNGVYKHAGAGTCFVSVQAGAFRVEASETTAAAPIETFTPTIAAEQIRTVPDEPFRGSSQTVDLGSAPLIV